MSDVDDKGEMQVFLLYGVTEIVIRSMRKWIIFLQKIREAFHFDAMCQ